MYALCRPAPCCNAAHQIMRVCHQMIAMAEILQIIITAETPNQRPISLWREARSALHPGHHHIRFEILQGALHAGLGQEIKSAAKGQLHRLQACTTQPPGTFRIAPDDRQDDIARVMQRDGGAFVEGFSTANRRAGHNLRNPHGFCPPWRSGSSRAFR